ncbi:ABC transporter ATP-binding protein [Humisphaera borealis]|uniref:ABC transporter ATP-binding protein n=1 Tax=Humisphaera borealis TaxID=2807512 RepID=A0A7M2WW27_9BACT|nr:ABC transporter ATP-binding protein [Humisphaera borealis]QOV89738.1 ABC transporter ATP-binding protein [Humisphaera borealis]
MISLQQIAVRAGVFALDDVSFVVPSGAYGVLMGPTGSGKTTLIEVICGLRKPAGGRVLVNDIDVTREPPGNRGIGYVPQDGAMFPTMTVREQIGFALRIRRLPRTEIDRRVDELSARLGVAHLLDRRPAGLSGGERQRVALGRALACRPAVLLLDEPLSALDETMRTGMRDLLKSVQRDFGASILHVTHDRSEAAALADVLFILSDGRVQPAEIHKQ